MAKLYVGTSGWSYRGWVGEFYPAGLDPGEWLEFYVQHFNTVEINATFYRLPFPGMVESWSRRAPEGFLYAVKGNRRITHLKRLRDVDADLSRFLERIEPLGAHLGVLLWQLPPRFPADVAVLEAFLRVLPPGYRHAVEFRDPSWLVGDVWTCLRRYGVAQVGVSSLRMPPEMEPTADFAYLRFHGLSGGFAHDYATEELRPWAERAAAVLAEGGDVFAYFNNDARCRAPKNAREFRELVEKLRD
ncbi:MAG: DUF72 domain-containing protein [Acidobacteriota bacterium]